MFLALILTIFIEYIFILFFVVDRKIGRKRIFMTVLAINLLTNPLANFIWLSGILGNYIIGLFLIEALVVLVETLFLKRYFSMSDKRAIFASLGANTLSFVLGAIINVVLYVLVNSSNPFADELINMPPTLREPIDLIHMAETYRTHRIEDTGVF